MSDLAYSILAEAAQTLVAELAPVAGQSFAEFCIGVKHASVECAVAVHVAFCPAVLQEHVQRLREVRLVAVHLLTEVAGL